MSSDERDPLQLLAHNPELRDMLHLPGVEAAIAAGKPHELYEILRRARKKSTGEGPRIDRLLADTRLFLQPVESAPSLFTFNGIGLRLTGKSEVGPDDAYVTHLFFTLLFIPLLPLARYVVWTEDGKNYLFVGKLPPTSLMRWWRRLLGAGVAAGIVAAVFAAVVASGTTDLHILNGLDVPVEVSVGERTLLLEPRGMEVIEVETGPQAFVSRRQDGLVIEELEADLPSFHDLVAYNIVGAAPLYAEGIIYSPKPLDETNPFEFYGGDSFVTRKTAKYLFRETPETIDLSGREKKRVLWQVGLASVGWPGTVAFLAQEQRNPRKALALLQEVIRAQWPDSTTLGLGLHLARTEVAPVLRKPDAELSLATQLVKDHPTSVEAHRALQDVSLARDKREELVQTYRQRFDTDPSADNGYLLARLLPLREGEALVDDLLGKHPDHPWLLRTRAWHLVHAARWEEATKTLEALARITGGDHTLFPLHARALAGEGRLADALRLAEGMEPDAFSGFETSVIYARLTRLAGAAADHPPHRLWRQAFGAEQEPGLLAKFELAAGLDADQTIEAIESEKERSARRLEREATRDPRSALAQAKLADAEILQDLRTDFLLLLLGAAAKAKDEESVAALAAALDPSLGYCLAYIRDGTETLDLYNLHPDVLTALRVARAYNLAGPPQTRMIELAKATDPLHGPAFLAAESWFTAD